MNSLLDVVDEIEAAWFVSGSYVLENTNE